MPTGSAPWRRPTNWFGSAFPSSPPDPPSGKLSFQDWYNQIGNGLAYSASFGSPAASYLEYLGASATPTNTATPPTQTTTQPNPAPTQTGQPTTPFYKPLPSYGTLSQPNQAFSSPNAGTALYTPQQYQSPLNQYYPFQYFGPSGGTGGYQQS